MPHRPGFSRCLASSPVLTCEGAKAEQSQTPKTEPSDTAVRPERTSMVSLAGYRLRAGCRHRLWLFSRSPAAPARRLPSSSSGSRSETLFCIVCNLALIFVMSTIVKGLRHCLHSTDRHQKVLGIFTIKSWNASCVQAMEICKHMAELDKVTLVTTKGKMQQEGIQNGGT
ncbi:hypothetical protein Cgig2_012077 [Carnegiea gigantea]|uniref:Uncharacterized protein n=1 Tax=Carnegiea gigantea TaxID=171969 RepID=A0A9Q1GY58_9CARY|nr:hypothetical protein Cgig2_012077 [Carnegiea gigantea]